MVVNQSARLMELELPHSAGRDGRKGREKAKIALAVFRIVYILSVSLWWLVGGAAGQRSRGGRGFGVIAGTGSLTY